MAKLVGGMSELQRRIAEYLMLDRGYDGVEFQKEIKNNGIKVIVDNRIMRKGDKTQQYRNTNIYYT